MVISELRSELRRTLCDNAHEADWIISHVTGMSISEFTMHPREITDNEQCRIRDIVERRMSGEPLQYILGETEFMGLRFYVTPDTLIPRADTETLVETVVERITENSFVLDIGAGSGCVGISIAKYKKARVSLLDYRDEILCIAEKNAHENNISCELIKCDILNEIPNGEYDIVVSNPPYIRTDVVKGLDITVKDYEPVTALDGGEDGLIFYRRIIHLAKDILLKNGGLLAFEIGFDQGREVSDIMTKNGFSDVQIIKDLCKNDRVVIGTKI